ncbi:MAG: DUF1318 domain-containing protein [Chitinivibrionales bacterium]|nr:DUF1318 domain-containing protein [Chitinivibrionales bacterium]
MCTCEWNASSRSSSRSKKNSKERSRTMATSRTASSNRPFGRTLAALVLVCLASGASTLTQAQTRDEIRERMRERFPQLLRLKGQGVVGETYLGYVSPVDPEQVGDEAARLIANENEDRRALYGIIAEETGAAVEAVGKINARRIFNDADDDHYFKGPDGEWRQKKNIDNGFWRPG